MFSLVWFGDVQGDFRGVGVRTAVRPFRESAPGDDALILLCDHDRVLGSMVFEPEALFFDGFRCRIKRPGGHLDRIIVNLGDHREIVFGCFTNVNVIFRHKR